MAHRILVVIPTLGQRKDWLIASIKSITSQEGIDAKVRVVAPTQASVGPTCSALGVELLEYNRKGLSAAIRRGWEECDDYDYVTWLGDDDLLAPGSLKRTAAVMASQPKTSIVYGAVRYIDSRGRTLWLQRPGRFAGWYIRYGKNLLPQQGSLLRKSAVQAIGGVDENFRSAMDQDLFTRLIDRGSYAYVRHEVAAFRLHESNITVTKGNAGSDEGELIRARHGGRLYPLLRPITKVTDRLIYAMIRRWPYPAPERVQGIPYTFARGQDMEPEPCTDGVS